MAELATIARPYAEALFRTATASGTDLADWAVLVTELAQIGAHADVQDFAHRPDVDRATVVPALLALVRTPMLPPVRALLEMLVENGRVSLLPEIGAQFVALKNASQGSAEAHIVSAFALEPGQLAALVQGLERKFACKLHPTVTVDPSLIGGVRVEVGDRVLDTSVRAQLQQLQLALAA